MENTSVKLSKFEERPYILTILHLLRANLKHNRYQEMYDAAHLHGDKYLKKKLRLISAAEVFGESNARLRED